MQRERLAADKAMNDAKLQSSEKRDNNFVNVLSMIGQAVATAASVMKPVPAASAEQPESRGQEMALG